MIPGHRSPVPPDVNTRILNVSLLPVAFSPSRDVFGARARARAGEKNRVHIGVSVRALERHDDASPLPPAAPLTRPRSPEDTRFSARFGGNARIRGVSRESRAFSVDSTADTGPIFPRRASSDIPFSVSFYDSIRGSVSSPLDR